MAANPMKGEASFEALGQNWTAVGGFLAICAIEEEFDKPAGEALLSIMPNVDAAALADPAKMATAAAGVKGRDIARLFKAFLSYHHPDLEDRQVFAIIHDLEVEGAVHIINRVMQRGAAPAQEGAPDGNPPQASRPAKRTGSR